MADSLFRKLTKTQLRRFALSGKIVDLGGARDADYHEFMIKNGQVTILNLDSKTQPDFIQDLEKPLPFKNESFDCALLINVLEHLYHYDLVLQETARILKSGGQVIIIVPFLFSIHAAPNDYFRYTKSALEQLCLDYGFRQITAREIGGGINTALANLAGRFLPPLFRELTEFSAQIADQLLLKIARSFNLSYQGTEYPLGYFIHARK